MSRFYLGAYWPPRNESSEACADRLHGFLRAVGSSKTSLSRWFLLGRSRKQALQHELDIEDRVTLVKLIETGRHRADIGQRIMYELGFSIALWNGGEAGSEAGLSVHCGDYATYSLYPNSVVLRLPHKLGELSTVGRMCEVLAATFAWEPDWAGIWRADAMDQRAFHVEVPFVDWMLYVSRKLLLSVPKFPCGTTVESLRSGTMIIVQDEPPDPMNPADVQRIQQVDSALRPALKLRAGHRV